ncbi:MAG: hypothetical protein WC873_01920 [Candidatus Gracilibacteria bacterium]
MKTSTTTAGLSDKKLYELCKHFGKLALNYRNKFTGLLPEVNRRRLYEQKSFLDKPALQELFTTGKISANKLARITSVATIANQEFLANQVQLLPKSAVETLVRDLRHETKSENQNGLFEAQIEAKSLPEQTRLNLSSEVIAKLSELQNKGLDINELILEFLNERKEKIENEKAEITAQASVTENSALARAKKTSRYIPAKTKKFLRSEYGTKCAITHCQKSAQTTHHTARFALSQAHDPNYLAPLCHEHHLIAHAIDRKFLDARKTPCG